MQNNMCLNDFVRFKGIHCSRNAQKVAEHILDEEKPTTSRQCFDNLSTTVNIDEEEGKEVEDHEDGDDEDDDIIPISHNVEMASDDDDDDEVFIKPTKRAKRKRAPLIKKSGVKKGKVTKK